VKRFALLICLVFFSFSTIYSDTYLSIDDAISIALENNYNISIEKNEVLIDKLNNTLGNSGFLPNISLNGGENYAINNINQLMSTQTGTSSIERQGATTSSLSANVALNWTIFDGGKMFITKQKLNEIEVQGELQLKAKVQQTLYAVIAAYYNIVKQKQQLLSINEAIDYNNERVKIARTTNNNGLSSKNVLLQAKIDLNVYKENAINQSNIISESKRTLNQLLARSPDSAFDVADSIFSNFIPDKKALLQQLFLNNTNLLIIQKELSISNLSIKELNSTRYPKININSTYSLSQVENSAGNLLRNNSAGFLVGASVSVPLFQGGNINRQVQVAKLRSQSTLFTLEDAKIQIVTELENELNNYETQIHLVQVESENEALTKENLNIAIERLRLGQITSLEAHQAQESFVEAQTRRINFNYNLKLVETRIKQLVAQY